MAMGSSLLVLAMLAADGPSCPPDETTTFQVRVITLEGLDWRTSSYSRLQPVARQGTSTIWTADRSLAVSLAERARTTSTFGKMIATGEAVFSKSETVNYVAAMDRYADGPMNQSTAIAFMPRPERIDERFAVRLTGRKIDQGILARVQIEETHVDAIHAVSQTETLMPKPSKTTRSPAEVGLDLLKAAFTANPAENAQAITCSVQIPEVSQSRIDGEWLIPNDGVLLVSLGVKTVADDQGKAVVRERLAVIESAAGSVPIPTEPTAFESGQPIPFAVSKLGMPAIPGRSMPQPVDPNGNEVDLPPLPEAVAAADLDRIKPAPFQPTPQSPLYAIPEPDSELARTSYTPLPRSQPQAADVASAPDEARSDLLQKLLQALADAGVNVDLGPGNPTLKAARSVCDKCDGDGMFCPADARDAKVAEAPGSLRLAPEPSPQIGISLKDQGGHQVFDAVSPLNEALKTPGKTETRYIPIGENISLEIKATVVPSSPKAEAKKTTTPSSKR